MRKNLIAVFLISLLILPVSTLWSADFGLIMDQNGIIRGSSSNNQPGYIGSLIPRVASFIGERGFFSASLGLNFEYSNDTFGFIPELLRTEFIWQFDNSDLVFGRMFYSDPLSLIASGLFDGAKLSFITSRGIFSMGAFYTGFLYKNRVNVFSSSVDSGNTELDYNDFFNTYFAPRHLLLSLDWEHPSLGGSFFGGGISILGQFDLNGDNYHSQYISGKFSFPLNAFLFDIGGSVNFIQDNSDFGIALAFGFGIYWTLPTALPSRLSFLSLYSSGTFHNGPMSAFQPFTVNPIGFVFDAPFSGISKISLDYIVRVYRTFSISLGSSFFIRNDLGTYDGYPLEGSGSTGYFLGNEFITQLYWSPFSDISLNLGGGLFLPFMGDAAPSAPISWKLGINLILSLY